MTATSDDLAALIGYVALASIVATLTHDRLDALDLAQPSVAQHPNVVYVKYLSLLSMFSYAHLVSAGAQPRLSG